MSPSYKLLCQVGLLLCCASAGAANSEEATVVALQVRATRDGGERAVATKEAVHSGEGISLQVRVDQPAYVYVVHVAPDGKSTILFPSTRDQLWRPGEPLRIPPAGKVLKLNQETGTEKIYVISSTQTIDRADHALCDHYGISSCTRGDPPPPETVPPKERGLAIGGDAPGATLRKRMDHGVALLRFDLNHVP